MPHLGKVYLDEKTKGLISRQRRIENMKKIRKLIMALCVIGIIGLMIPVTVRADEETVTLDLGNGAIDITSTGYKQGGGSEVAFTGSYVITGSLTADTPLDIDNNSGSLFTCNITLDNASIKGAVWCTAVRINGNSDIVLNITNIGDSVIKGYNHAALVSGNTANVTVNITNTEGNRLEMDSIWGSTDRVFSFWQGTMAAYVNGEVPDNNRSMIDHTCVYQYSWISNVSEMSIDEFTENFYNVKLVGVCMCGATTEADTLDRVYTEPTCTEDGEGYYKAVMDGVEYESPHYVWASLSHQIVDVPAVDVTCETDGSIEYWTCTRCGAKFSDENATSEITDEDIEIAASGHVYGNEWVYDSEDHWKVCTVCDSIADKASHVWSDWTITKKATHSVDGSRERTCSECGYKMTETIPALKDRTDPTTETEQTTEVTTAASTEQVTDNSTEITTEATMEAKNSAPNTGDTENVALYIIICGLSIAGMIVIIGKKRGFDKK